VKFGQREIGAIVRQRYLPDKKTTKFWLPFKVSLLRWSRPKSASPQPPSMYSACFRFHPNRFTFGGVI